MINFKVRAKNPHFWLQVVLAIAAPVGAYFGLTGADLTTWPALLDVIVSAVSNPYVIGLIFVSVYNAVNDPTTAGFSDSKRAMMYDEPKKDAW